MVGDAVQFCGGWLRNPQRELQTAKQYMDTLYTWKLRRDPMLYFADVKVGQDVYVTYC